MHRGANMISKFGAVLFALFFYQLIAPAAFGQATGGLSGTVTDPNGALVEGANIGVKNTATNLTRNTTTNEDGRWTLALLPVGNYDVTYEKEGFKKSVTHNVGVEASVQRVVDVALEVGTTDIFVDVTSDQPLVQADSAAVARQITGEEVTKMPTSTRSFTGLLSSEAGVSAE